MKGMDRYLFWLKTSYRTGTVAGMAAALQMISPRLFALPVQGSFPSVFHLFAIFFLAGVFLLLWGGRRPEQRKKFLFPLFFLLLFAWIAVESSGLLLGGGSSAARLPFGLPQAFLFFLFALSSLRARRFCARWWPRRA